MEAPLIEGRGLSKRFGGVVALEGVDFSAAAGKVTALLGANGAGKSTLVACLTGAHRPDRGSVRLGGAERRFRSPDDAMRAGVAVIHQEPQMLEQQSVAANIFLPRLAAAGVLAARSRNLEVEAARRLDELQIEGLDPSQIVGTTTGAQRQLIEIARALLRQPAVLFLDEPNASLGAKESDRLFAVVRKLRARGVAVVLVSHRLKEVYDVADQIVVMRNGRKVADEPAERLILDEAVALMSGGAKPAAAAPSTASHRATSTGEPVLAVERLSGSRFANVSFSIRRGEIVGMTGLVGSGRTEIAQAVIGAERPQSGAVLLGGKRQTFTDPSDALRAGVAFVPETRRDAVFYGQTVEANIRAGMLGKTPPGGARPSRSEATRLVRQLIGGLAIKSSGPAALASQLSGGNQQKAILARALAARPRVLILDEPTHGIDVGAKREIHALVRRLAADGLAVWFISSEADEVAELADRAIVVQRGRIAGEVEAPISVARLVALSFHDMGGRDGL